MLQELVEKQGFEAPDGTIVPFNEELMAKAFNLPLEGITKAEMASEQEMLEVFREKKGKEFSISTCPENAKKDQYQFLIKNIMLLAKSSYMGRSTYGLIREAEQGHQVAWGSVLYNNINKILKKTEGKGGKVKIMAHLNQLYQTTTKGVNKDKLEVVPVPNPTR